MKLRGFFLLLLLAIALAAAVVWWRRRRTQAARRPIQFGLEDGRTRDLDEADASAARLQMLAADVRRAFAG